MEDINYNELFGLEEQGEKEQEAAEPAESQAEQGEKAREAAEPAEDGRENQEETKPTGPAKEEPAARQDQEAPEEAAGKDAEEKKRNAQFAAARRKAEAERDAAVQKAKEEAMAEAQRFLDEAFAKSGIINPYTEKPVQSKKEYEEYQKRFAEEQAKNVQRRAGMSDDEFHKFVESLPEVREARQAKQAAEESQRAARDAEARVKVEEQIREIGKLDPSIQSIEDLSKMPTYPQFYELVKKGNSLPDAFKLANYETLTRSAAAGAKQAALNAVQGKQHLEGTKPRGSGQTQVPQDVREMYRVFNPGATDAEIQRHYEKNHKAE